MIPINTSKVLEAAAATVVVLVAGAVILPAVGIVAAIALVAGGLVAMATVEAKKRAY